MLYCPGAGCPLRSDCYRHTQPTPGRDAFASLPYDAATGTCRWFESNIPKDSSIRETAYYLWLKAGCPEGRSEELWAAARKSLSASLGRKNS